MTVHARVAEAGGRLRRAGIPPDEANLDARLLAEFALGWDAARFYAFAAEPEPPSFSARYTTLVARRAAREPLAYITGRQEFWGLSFEVTPAVLIPRPETELIVEAALDLFPDVAGRLAIADACTGGGCLAVALARERPGARVIATDISDAALEVARRNAARHGVDARTEFVAADILATLDGPFDLIVSNPPYVAERDRLSLQPEVRDHEPALALFAGDDGLSVLRRLVAQAVSKLTPNGILIFEFGFGQVDAVSRLIAETAGLTMLNMRHDLQGIPRTAVAQRPAIGT